MNDTSKIEYKNDVNEIYGYKETPVVTLPQFAIDRIQPCIDEFENGLTMQGAIMFINGIDRNDKKLEDSSDWKDYLPAGLPKLTPEFIKWRDGLFFSHTRQMKIMLALIYRYELEETLGQTELDIDDQSND